MTFLRRLAGAAAASAIAAACGSSGNSTFQDTNGDGDAGGTGGDGSDLGTTDGGTTGDGGYHAGPCTTDQDCGAGGVCDPVSHTCGCGGKAVASQINPPNMLLVEDRSCSMTDKVQGTPKWNIAVKAMNGLTTAYTNKIRFGLTLFPDTDANQCAQGTIPIPVGAGNETKIQTLLNAALNKSDPNFPDGPCVTNIDTAMQQAATEPSFNDKTRASYAVLITDGMQANCNAGGGNPGTLKAITDLFAKGVGTFVIGFGAQVDVQSLDSFAVAGGHPSSGAHKFYQADDQQTLDTILGNLAQSALSCDLTLAEGPPGGDPSLIYVYFNQTPPPIPRDPSHKDGWDYDPNGTVVHFYGSACDKLKGGQVQDAHVVFGCAGGPVPPPK